MVLSDKVVNIVLFEDLEAVDDFVVFKDLVDFEFVLYKLGGFFVWVQIEIDHFDGDGESIGNSLSLVHFAVAPDAD